MKSSLEYIVPRLPHPTSESWSGTVVQIFGPRVKCLFALNKDICRLEQVTIPKCLQSIGFGSLGMRLPHHNGQVSSELFHSFVA